MPVTYMNKHGGEYLYRRFTSPIVISLFLGSPSTREVRAAARRNLLLISGYTKPAMQSTSLRRVC